MRNIIISDIHGSKKLLHNIFRQSEFNPKYDKLIVLGDWTDIGEDSQYVWDKVKEYADVILFGNHDIAHILNIGISPYDYSIDYTDIPSEMYDMYKNGEIKIVHNIGDIILSHAGISNNFVNHYLKDHPMDDVIFTVEELVKKINSIHPQDLARVESGPFWYRIDWYNCPFPIRQITGHTPMEYYKKIGINVPDNFYTIDPFCRKNFDHPNYYKYAVIDENNNVEIFEYNEVNN